MVPTERRKTMTARRLLSVIAVIALLTALGGCVTLSMNPLFENDDLVIDPLLQGLWGDPDDPDSDTWQFTPRNDGSYELIIREENTLRIDPARDGVFTAHLLTIGDDYYLDLFPSEPVQGSDFFKCHIVPAHSFWHVALEGNVLVLRALDGGDLDRAINEGRIVIDHVKRDDVGVLTATTPDLQRLVSEHLEEIFDEGEQIMRLR